MKTKKLELNVDYIGGQDPLTEEEEKSLSEFFKKKKLLSRKGKPTHKPRTVRPKKVSAYYDNGQNSTGANK